MIFLRERTRSLRAALLIAMLAGGILRNAGAEDNGLERTPVLGWSSWSFLRKNPTAALVKAQALALQNSGLQKIGYQYVNLDDFWYQCPGPQGPNVDAYGRWVTDSSKFPAEGDTDGMKVMADYIHSLGMNSESMYAGYFPASGQPEHADQGHIVHGLPDCGAVGKGEQLQLQGHGPH